MQRKKKKRVVLTPVSESGPRMLTRKDVCADCEKDLKGSDQVLFVEEEVGRVFCSEECIGNHLSPEVELLESQYLDQLGQDELESELRQALEESLRVKTLSSPEEIWRESTMAGDYRYTLINLYKKDGFKVWNVCICLMLRSEPSFLYLSFVSNDSKLIEKYRNGERVQWTFASKGREIENWAVYEDDSPEKSDGPATDWTKGDTLRASLSQERAKTDIPEERFGEYHHCLDETVQNPDEIWTIDHEDEENFHLYHFIRQHREEDPWIWYIVVAKQTESEEEIEILDAFPSRDSSLVDRYRCGVREDEESTHTSQKSYNRVVH